MSPDAVPGRGAAFGGTYAQAPARLGTHQGSSAGAFRERPRVWGETWNIGISTLTFADLLGGARLSSEPRWLFHASRDWFPSDPCLVRADDRDFLFYERFDRTTSRACIHCAELMGGGEGELHGDRCILSESFHLSHPFVFRYEDRWYLIPEAAQSGSVRLYGAVDFPWAWEPVKVLLPGFAGIDPTFLFHDGRCWLFAGKLDGDHDAHLFAFHARSLFGPWRPHAENPVKTSRHGARPAGNFIQSAGRLFRPAQDSRFTYGQAVVIHEIERLDPDGFREQPLARLEPLPGWRYPHGAHTCCVGDGFLVVDAKRFTGLKQVAGPGLTRLRRWRLRRELP